MSALCVSMDLAMEIRVRQIRGPRRGLTKQDVLQAWCDASRASRRPAQLITYGILVHVWTHSSHFVVCMLSNSVCFIS